MRVGLGWVVKLGITEGSGALFAWRTADSAYAGVVAEPIVMVGFRGTMSRKGCHHGLPVHTGECLPLPQGSTQGSSFLPATLPTATSTIVAATLNDDARLAPTWNVVATTLAPTKIRKRSNVDCVCSPGATGRMSAAFTLARIHVRLALN